MQINNFISLVPLCGGASIGVTQALNNKMPSQIISYSAFKHNDNMYTHYLNSVHNQDIKYTNLDQQPDYKPNYDVDLVVSVCPCAGLSSLSTISHKKDNEKVKATNQWILKTAEYALGTIKPKIYFGQNALKLATNMGRSILLQLSDIGKKYGYKLTIVKTDLRDYGIPQKRTRTLYFFYKDFLYFDKPNIDTPDLIDYLNQKPVTRGDDVSCQSFKFLVHKYGLDNVFDKLQYVQTYKYIINNDLVDQFKQFTDNHKQIDHIIKKFSENKNSYYYGVYYTKTHVGSLTGRALREYINPVTKDTHYSLNDCIHLMAMPDDYTLKNESKDFCRIFQNVSPAITKYYTQQLLHYKPNTDREVKQFVGDNCIIIDNINQRKTLSKM